MNDRQLFRLVHDTARNRACEAVRKATHGMVVEIKPPTRTLEQNRLLHAALTDLAEQVDWRGLRFDVDTWKRLCTAAWLRERGEQPELIPALDGKGFDIIYEHTSKMTVQQLSELLEWIFAFGAQNGCQFKERPL